MRNIFYMLYLAALDIRRLVGSLLHTSTVLTGTGLALVLLWGLTDGLVRMQEKALESSPTATVVSAWLTSGKGTPLTRTSEARWLTDNPTIVAVVPDIKKVVTVRSEANGKQWDNLTLQCTVPGDPLLAFHQADVLHEGERGLVLSRFAADKLGIKYAPSDRAFMVEPGEAVTVQVSRSENGKGQGKVSLSMAVRGVIDFGDTGFAYADRQILDWMEDYQQGRAVPELGWKAFAKKAPVTYSGYLSFMRSPLEPSDLTRLTARGLTAQRLDVVIDPERCMLRGLLNSNGLHVYFVTAAGSTRLSLTAQEVEDITDTDDVAVPWAEPMNVRFAGRDIRLLGISLQKRWLQRFFMRPEAGFPVDMSEPAIQRFPFLGGIPPVPERGIIELATGKTIPVTVHHHPTMPLTAVLACIQPGDPFFGLGSISIFSLPSHQGNSPIGVVPAEILANLHALKNGDVLFDKDLNLFLPLPQENVYYQGRFYARSLHEVPFVDAAVIQAGFTTHSERTRIEEIQNYARILRLLVTFVGGIVLISGLCTLTAVFSDNTARKRGALGVLRLIGVSRLGILTFVVGRALLIGCVAALMLLPLSLLFAWLLTRLGALCVLQTDHMAIVVVLALGSSLIGVIYPAFVAGRIDPMKEIAAGNQH